MVKVELTDRFARHRIKDPDEFIKTSFRTHDIGRPMHSKRIAGRLKKTGKWATQSLLINRKDYEKGMRVKKVGKAYKIVKSKKYWK